MKRKIRIDGDVAYVPLTKGYESVIDIGDVPLVDGWNWSALVVKLKDGTVRCVYAIRHKKTNGKQQTIQMHRVIAGTQHGLETDHEDGDGLNNRRSNLRPATVAQNQYNARIRSDNTSGVKGVHFNKKRGKWLCKIKVDGKVRYLGEYSDIEVAAAARAKASAELHGDFGRDR